MEGIASVNNLTQLEGPRKVGVFGEFGENGDFGKISLKLWMKCRDRIN